MHGHHTSLLQLVELLNTLNQSMWTNWWPLQFYYENIGISTQFSSCRLYTPPQWIWNETNKMCFNCRLSALIWGYLHPNQVNSVGITSFYMCLPLFKGPKVMGQTNNHKSNFQFLILGCKSFSVNYRLKSGMHRYHQTLGFIPLLQLSSVPACSLGIFPSVLSSASEMHAMRIVLMSQYLWTWLYVLDNPYVGYVCA